MAWLSIDTDCQSEYALEVLSKTSLWETLEQQWIYFSITETEYGEKPILWKTSGKNINPLKDDPIALCELSLNRPLRWLKQEVETELDSTINFNDWHFNILHKLTGKYNEIKILPVYKKIKRMNMGSITKSQAVIASHYGYTKENWDEACALMEQKISSDNFLITYSEVFR